MMSIDEWRDEGDFFSFSNHQIFYRTSQKGHKQTLLLIHGFPTSSYDYQHVWSELSQLFNLVTLDMIGYGLSDKPVNFSYSIKTQADIIIQLLELLDIKQLHVLSHDYGDSVAQELIARDIESRHYDISTQKILSLILLNGGIIPESQRPILLQKLLLGPFGNLIARFTSYARFKKNFDKICAVKIPEDELRNYWELMSLKDGLYRVPQIIQYIKERKINSDRWVGALQNAQCPIRFINGLLDPVSGEYMVASYKRLVKNADVVELAETGHYPQVESPDLVLNAAIEFWQKHFK